MQNPIITQIVSMIKGSGMAPEIVTKALGLLDGIDMADIAGLMPELSKLGLPADLLSKIEGMLGGQVVDSLLGGLGGSADATKDAVQEGLGQVGDTLKNANPAETITKGAGIWGMIKGIFGK